MSETSAVLNYLICGIDIDSSGQWSPGTKAWHTGYGALTNPNTRRIFGDVTNYAHTVGAVLLF